MKWEKEESLISIEGNLNKKFRDAETERHKHKEEISQRASFYSQKVNLVNGKYKSISCDFQKKLNEDYKHQMKKYQILFNIHTALKEK